MLLGRLKITSLLIVAALACNSAEACWLTDWLYGRSASPYAVGYAPYAVNDGSYAANYTPYVAGYTPTAGYASTTVLPLRSPVVTSGAFQVQRPSYLENASVYTGAPVGANLQTAYSVPVTTPPLFRQNPSLLGAGSTSSYFGASNTYPNYPVPFAGSYAANYPSVSTGGPATTLSTTRVPTRFSNVPVSGVPVRSTPLFRGGLARFFGSLFGTNYRTSYYGAPVTYYRPATSVDPLTGTTVTVQQPCTSTIEQLQRTPYNSFQFTQPSTTPIGGPMPTAGCGSPGLGFAPSGVSPATMLSSPNLAPSQFAVPIPSTVMPPSGYGQSPSHHAAPLTGSPSAPQPQSDLSPMEQPSLNRVPVESNHESSRYRQTDRVAPRSGYQYESGSSSPTKAPEPRTEGKSLPGYWDMQDADDSTAMISPKRDRRPPSFVNNHPIRAIDDVALDRDLEPSPFRSDLMGRDTDRRNTAMGGNDSFEAPPLPARSSRDQGFRVPETINRVQPAAAWIPVREASSRNNVSPRFVPRAQDAPRDNVWNTGR